jgi:hypothetical protein
VATEAVLEEVNRIAGRRWRLCDRLEGGFQSGATLVADDEGFAVLKWTEWKPWAPRVLAARGLVDRARRAGYPTPAWLAAGVTSDGFPFQVHEFVEGEPFGGVTAGNVDCFFDLIALQRRIELEPAVDWTDYLAALVFADPEGHAQRLRDRGGPAAEATRAATRLAGPHRDAALVHTEMVHGDLSVDNLIARDGAIVGVVDIEALGRGTAAYDLLTPARQAYMWQGDRTVADQLVNTSLSTDGPSIVAIAVAAHVINILAFGLDNWDHGMDEAAVTCLEWIARVEDLI